MSAFVRISFSISTIRIRQIRRILDILRLRIIKFIITESEENVLVKLNQLQLLSSSTC